MPPFLSIVTISFNQRDYLRQCVDSVVSQKGTDVEYIVVDPGSTDGSREILKGYGSAIDHLLLQPDRGAADGLNKGFALATGRYGYFINSDDYLLPGAVAKMRRLWSESPHVDVLLAGAWMVDKEGQPLRELRSTNARLEDFLGGQATLAQQGMSFRMEAFKQLGGFNPENRTCWDYELLVALLHSGATSRVARERVGAFRLYSESLSGGVKGKAHTRRYVADLDRIHRDLTGHPRPNKASMRIAVDRLAYLLLRPGRLMLKIRDRYFRSSMRQRWLRDVNSGSGAV